MVAAGWDGDRTSVIPSNFESSYRAELAQKGMMNADVCVFHRPNDDRAFNVATQLKKMGKKIVYDNDDTYKNFTGLEKYQEKRLEYVDRWTDRFIREMADLVTCSTEFLADEYRKLNPNVVVLPNCVDPMDWPDEPQRNDNGKVRIGFVGSVAMNDDFKSLGPVLEKLTKRDDVEVIMFSLPPKSNPKVMRMYKEDYAFWDNLNVQWQPFVGIQDYIETLDNLKLDMMLIPRHDDYFNRCKSNLKFLEASMLEIPCIMQGFADGLSPYQINPKDGQYGQIIVDNSQWESAIEDLIKNPEKRREIGKKAREYVLSEYDISKHIHKWERAYASLFSK